MQSMMLNMTYPVEIIRADFPSLAKKNFIYFDNAAFCQQPQCVIDCVTSQPQPTLTLFDSVREKVAAFINASCSSQISLLESSTTAIQNVAEHYWLENLQTGDEIVVTAMEHQANYLPWQKLCEACGAVLKIVPLHGNGELRKVDLSAALTYKTKFVALIQVSNVLGTLNPVKEMIALAHAKNIPVLVDGAQAIAHLPLDVQDLDCDFYVFSAKKLYASTGVAVLYSKQAILTHAHRLTEINTLNSTAVASLAVAITYLNTLGMANIAVYETNLLNYAVAQVQMMTDLQLVGQAANRKALLSFVLPHITPQKIAYFLNQQGIVVRAGHHYAEGIMRFFHLSETVRLSIGLYNTVAEIDTVIQVIQQLNKHE